MTMTCTASPDQDEFDLLGLTSISLPWQEDALCAQTDPECFFPEKGTSARDAIAVCQQCPVAEECLAFALREQVAHGVWGGKTPFQRRQMLKQKQAAS